MDIITEYAHAQVDVVKGHYFTRDYELNQGLGDDFVQGRDYKTRPIPTLSHTVSDDTRKSIQWKRAEFGPDDNPGDRDLAFTSNTSCDPSGTIVAA